MSHSHDDLVSPAALKLCGAIVGVALIATATARIAGMTPAASPAALRAAERVAPLASRDLTFADRVDGAVVIADAGNGARAGMVAPGEKSGFIRGVMRGLARDRHKRGLGEAAPFRLTAWADGELSLTDLATGRQIELSGFGATNRAAFAALLGPEHRL